MWLHNSEEEQWRRAEPWLPHQPDECQRAQPAVLHGADGHPAGYLCCRCQTQPVLWPRQQPAPQCQHLQPGPHSTLQLPQSVPAYCCLWVGGRGGGGWGVWMFIITVGWESGYPQRLLVNVSGFSLSAFSGHAQVVFCLFCFCGVGGEGGGLADLWTQPSSCSGPLFMYFVRID